MDCWFRLNAILAKRQLAPQKLAEMKIKANILGAFIAKKSEEAKEKVAEKIAEIRDEL
jgi:protein disulfide-isomerase A6